MKIIDAWLNRFTMYRLTIYYLIALLLAAMVLSYFNILPYNPGDILLDALIAFISGYASNYIFAKWFGATINFESVLITTLILVLIIPVKFPLNAAFLAGAAVVAMGVKYFPTIDKQHLFNPAAAAVAAIAMLSPEHSATWWIGTPALLPYVLVGGFLLVRKIERASLLAVFFTVYLGFIGMELLFRHGSPAAVWNLWLISIEHSAVFFFAFVMLTEPLTSPATKKLRGIYGALVGLLYATPRFPIFGISLTPELALCVGNLFSYIVSPKYRLGLTLQSRQAVSADSYYFSFSPTPGFNFRPGQYMEWVLPHEHPDNRGKRRYFSLASSPTEPNPAVLVKFYNPSSSFKKALLNLRPGQAITALHLAGDFTLPRNLKQPLVFIAGGVGIAPFRSMIQYIVDHKIACDIVLLFANRRPEDIMFRDLFDRARQYGVKTVYALSDTSQPIDDPAVALGRVDSRLIQSILPDYPQRKFYISGPQLMVQSLRELLLAMSVKRSAIITDYFPGYTES